MEPFLKHVVLEGRNGRRRQLDFLPGINIITGVGSKGKSTVLHIIEYCLGATRCNIPVGRIRDFSAWYFLILYVKNTRVIIGREGPGDNGQLSAEAYFAYGPDCSIPAPLQANSTVQGACQALGKLLELPEGQYLLDSTADVHGRVSVPDIIPIMLQSQDTIATHQLFMRLPAKSAPLTETLRIALGIISPDLIALRTRRDRIRSRIQSVNSRKAEAFRRYNEAARSLEQLRQEAILAGILPIRPLGSGEDARSELDALRTASTTDLSSAASETSALVELESKSQELRRELRGFSAQLTQIGRIRSAANDADQSLRTQSSRLRVVDILGSPAQDALPCPLCGSQIGSDTEALVADMQSRLADDLKFVASIPPELEAQERELRTELGRVKEELRKTEAELRGLQEHEPAGSMNEERVRRERLIGAMEHAYRWIPQAPGIEFDVEIAGLKKDLEDVDNAIRSATAERDEVVIRQSLKSRLTGLAQRLEPLQIANGTLAFDEPFSTLEQWNGAQRHSLAELGGSGKLVMYHVCAMLGLHEQFLSPNTPGASDSTSSSFVPPMLVLDQPSQPVFPSDNDKEGEDVRAIRAIYDLLFTVAERLENRLQVIVLDHADFSDDPRFKNAKRYDWHGAEGLITDDLDG